MTESTLRQRVTKAESGLIGSLPEFMNFKLFGKTILEVIIKFGLLLGHPLSQRVGVFPRKAKELHHGAPPKLTNHGCINPGFPLAASGFGLGQHGA